MRVQQELDETKVILVSHRSFSLCEEKALN